MRRRQQMQQHGPSVAVCVTAVLIAVVVAVGVLASGVAATLASTTHHSATTGTRAHTGAVPPHSIPSTLQVDSDGHVVTSEVDEPPAEPQIRHGSGQHSRPHIDADTSTLIGTNGLFSMVDANHDSTLNLKELKAFIKSMGTADYDEASEIDAAAGAAVRHAQRHDDVEDDGVDDTLSLEDLLLFWEELGKAMTVDEVADWLRHAVQLPQYVSTFREHGITGYDFPALLENGGESLRADLGIVRLAHVRIIVRALQQKLLALADVPDAPPPPMWQSPSCTSLALRWTRPDSNGMDIHKYTLQRRQVDNGDWMLVYSGIAEIFVDDTVAPGVLYDYRLVAWNIIGRSSYTYVRQAHTGVGCTTSVLGPINSLVSAIQLIVLCVVIGYIIFKLYGFAQLGSLESVYGKTEQLRQPSHRTEARQHAGWTASNRALVRTTTQRALNGGGGSGDSGKLLGTKLTTPYECPHFNDHRHTCVSCNGHFCSKCGKTNHMFVGGACTNCHCNKCLSG